MPEYKGMFYFQNGINSMNTLYTGLHKNFQIHYGLWGKIISSIFYNIYIALNVMKLTVGSKIIRALAIILAIFL